MAADVATEDMPGTRPLPPMAVKIAPWGPAAPRLVPPIALPPRRGDGRLDDDLDGDVEAFLGTITVARTKDAYRAQLRAFLEDLGGELLTKARIKTYAAALLAGGHRPVLPRGRPRRGPGLSPASVRLRLAAASAFFGYLKDDGRCPLNPCEGIEVGKVARSEQERDLEGNPAPPVPQPQKAPAISLQEVLALLKAPPERHPDGRPHLVGLRDRALLAIGFSTGMRRSELVGLRMRDLVMHDEVLALRVRPAKARREGTPELVHPVIPWARTPLEAYLDHRVEVEDAPLFASHHQTARGRTSPPGLRGRQVDEIVKRWALALGLSERCPLPGEHRHAGALCRGRRAMLSAHSMRSTYVTLLLAAGIPANRVRLAVGHATIEMTARYDRTELDLKQHPAWALQRF